MEKPSRFTILAPSRCTSPPLHVGNSAPSWAGASPPARLHLGRFRAPGHSILAGGAGRPLSRSWCSEAVSGTTSEPRAVASTLVLQPLFLLLRIDVTPCRPRLRPRGKKSLGGNHEVAGGRARTRAVVTVSFPRSQCADATRDRERRLSRVLYVLAVSTKQKSRTSQVCAHGRWRRDLEAAVMEKEELPSAQNDTFHQLVVGET